MVYICVGLDCAGKTTMVTEVAKKNGALVRKGACSLNAEEKKSYIELLEEDIRSKEEVYYDRIPLIDDFVYSAIFKETCCFGTKYQQQIRELLKQCVVIYIHADFKTLQERLALRGDEYVAKDVLPDIEYNYKEYFCSNNIEFEDIDTSLLSVEESVSALEALVLRVSKKKKTPKLAHIVPVSCLNETERNQYHMCLLQNFENEKYKTFFKERAAEGKFVLLDNGAAEGEERSIAELAELAREIRVSEIIIPDVLQDAKNTIRKAEEAISYLEKNKLTIPYMLVPQGANFEEWVNCASYFISRYDMRSIGIPKILEKDNIFMRIFAVEKIRELLKLYSKEDVEIHLLGCNTTPAVLRMIFESYEEVRGCDSAFAYLLSEDKNTEVTLNSKRRISSSINFLEGEYRENLLSTMEQINTLVGVYNDVDYSWSK